MQQRMAGSSGFAFSSDMKEVAEIEAEQALVAANRELIARFEKKIQAALARVWGEEASAAQQPCVVEEPAEAGVLPSGGVDRAVKETL